MRCKICNNNQTKVIYSGTLRNGKFGQRTEEAYRVNKCNKCKVCFIDPIPSDLKNFYETEKYRKTYNNSTDIKEFHRLYDKEKSKYLNEIGAEKLRDKVLADYGTGGGSFLDITYGLIRTGIAVEPSKIYHKELRRKYTVFSWAKDLVKANIKIDIATAFDVVEHVEDPKDFFKDIRKTLRSEGKLYIIVPNHEDILKSLCLDSFNQYDYRTAHLFYFNKTSMIRLLKLSGFTKIKVVFYHKYDFSNLVSWLRYNKPTGIGKISYFSEEFNRAYIKELERLEKTSHLWVEAEK